MTHPTAGPSTATRAGRSPVQYAALPFPATSRSRRNTARSPRSTPNFSDGAAAAEGSWASGPTPDGHGGFSYHDGPTTSAPMPDVTRPDPRLFGTSDKPNSMEKMTAKVKDTFNKQ